MRAAGILQYNAANLYFADIMGRVFFVLAAAVLWWLLRLVRRVGPDGA